MTEAGLRVLLGKHPVLFKYYPDSKLVTYNNTERILCASIRFSLK